MDFTDLQVPDPYLSNPFQILRLPANTLPRDVEKHSQRLRMRAKFGEEEGTNSTEKIQEALEAIRDPLTRIEHELFWYRYDSTDHEKWTTYPELYEFPQELHRVAGKRYMRLFEHHELLESWHNAAVLYHGQAIRLEVRRLQGKWTDKANMIHDELWKNAYRYWSNIIVSDQFWKLYEERARCFDDTRITNNVLSKIRKDVSDKLLQPTVRIANHYLLMGDTSNAMRHISYLKNSDLEQTAIDKALSQFYKDISKQVKRIVSDTSRKIEQLEIATIPSEILSDLSTQVAQELKPHLETISKLGDLPGRLEENTQDMAAELLNEISYKAEGCNDYQLAQFLTSKAKVWASSLSLKNDFDQRAESLGARAVNSKIHELRQSAEAAKEDKDYPRATQLFKEAVTLDHSGELNSSYDVFCDSIGFEIIESAGEDAAIDDRLAALRRALQFVGTTEFRSAIEKKIVELNEFQNINNIIERAVQEKKRGNYHNAIKIYKSAINVVSEQERSDLIEYFNRFCDQIAVEVLDRRKANLTLSEAKAVYTKALGFSRSAELQNSIKDALNQVTEAQEKKTRDSVLGCLFWPFILFIFWLLEALGVL